MGTLSACTERKSKERIRAAGHLDPEKLIALILSGRAMAKFNQPVHPAADILFEQLSSTYSKSALTPEAIFMQGVAS